MLLSSLLKSCIEVPPAVANVAVSGITLDSRQVQPGYVFCALAGSQADGQAFIDDAVQRGAVAVLVEKAGFNQTGHIPVLVIPRLKHVVGDIAATFYEYPSQTLKVFGVTGTNGKTSCTHFLAQILTQLGQTTGVIGTLGQGLLGQLKDTGLTTPDAISLQQHLQQFVKADAKAAAIEVSSHAIDQGRINGVQFAAGIFTNLTQDHLDYHGTMANYAATKKRFLESYPLQQVIINADDTYGATWLNDLKTTKRTLVAYSLHSQSLAVPTVSVISMTRCAEGADITLQTPWGKGDVFIPLLGDYNISNVLAVIAALGVCGFPFDSILNAVRQLTPVAGRLQRVAIPKHPQRQYVVDYAHTPDALKNALQAMRPYTSGRLICVFGCGGNRDAAKRPMMAEIAEAYADLVMVTSDNPRHEAPDTIIDQIMSGFKRPEAVKIEQNRSKAIQNSIQWALDGDCVLIAGKGAEQYQQIGDKRIPFSDVAEVLRHTNVDTARTITPE